MNAAGRDNSLDIFKGLLVVGMVTIHVYQLLARSMPGWVPPVSDAINLLTFSGFLFALGIGAGLGRERDRGWGERLMPVAMLLAATWISSLAFVVLVDRLPLTVPLLLDLLLLRRLFGWSEFLASFAMLYLLLALFRTHLLRMATDPLCLALSLGLAFASTWIVVDGNWPAMATLLSTTDFASFPLLPYLPWFLLGIRLGRSGGRIEPWMWLAAAASTACFAWHSLSLGALPGRFPPTALWVAGPALLLLVYWVLARTLAQLPVMAVLALPGRHVLSFLLLSNLAIFALRSLMGRPVTHVGNWLAVSVALLIGLTVAWWLGERSWGLRRRSAWPGVGG